MQKKEQRKETDKRKQHKSSFDYKDTSTLKHYLTETYKIARPRSKLMTAKLQRTLNRAIKRARFLALLPYTDQHRSTR